MVLIPVIGVNLLDLFSVDLKNESSASVVPLLIGFITAFLSGLVACRWMIKIVRKGKLIYFGLYCFIIGSIAVLTQII